jgi:8-oxo-dGTP pyrophosphatase MutT (NUDIX family)
MSGKPMLDLDLSREGAPPRDAATLLVVRGGDPGLEVFCVERHAKSAFLGGAIVFPGGKVDAEDASEAWEAAIEPKEVEHRAQRIAACREAIEEAAILPVTGGALDHATLLELRARLARGEASLASVLAERGLRLDLGALVPFARWVTPIAEARRYDTRFYLTELPRGQEGAHDQRETTSSFWARPADVIARFERGEVQLAPPTHRSLEILATAGTVARAKEAAATACLDPICPKVVMQDGVLALVLPGDPEHDVREARAPGKSRYVLRGDRFVPEDAPATGAP